MASRQVCVLIFPVVGSLQPVRADLIQWDSNSDSLIPPWKKHLAHSEQRVLPLRGEAAPSEKRKSSGDSPRGPGFCFCCFQAKEKECCRCEGLSHHVLLPPWPLIPSLGVVWPLIGKIGGGMDAFSHCLLCGCLYLSMCARKNR